MAELRHAGGEDGRGQKSSIDASSGETERQDDRRTALRREKAGAVSIAFAKLIVLRWTLPLVRP
jgi:hypothetical protein